MRTHEFDLERFGPYAVLQTRDATILAVTDGVLELLGYSADELVGRNGWSLTPEVNEQRRERVLGTLEVAGALTDVETVRRKDGTFLRFAYLAQLVDDEHVVVSGEPVPPDGFTTPTVAAELERANAAGAPGAAAARLELATLPPGRWLTTAEAVDYSRRSASTIRRAVDDGLLARGGTARRALYHTSALDRWLRGGGGMALLAAMLALAYALACTGLGDESCHFLHELSPPFHGDA